MEPDWSDLKVLLAIARARSVAGAARVLKVDQSTVSRRLAALEETVGVGLVVRGGRELTMTPAGQLLEAAAERVEAIVTEASIAVRASKDDVAGIVRLTCPPGFLLHVMAALKALREKHPDLVCEVSGDYRTVDLSRGEADLALRAFRPTEPDLVARKLTDLGWGVYASHAYRDAHGLPATFDDLPAHALILYPVTMHSVPGLRWMDEHKGTATEVVRVDNIELAAQIILSNSGIGVLPAFVAAHHPQLVKVFAENIALATLYCVYHESSRNTARVRTAADALAAYFEANASAFLDGAATT